MNKQGGDNDSDNKYDKSSKTTVAILEVLTVMWLKIQILHLQALQFFAALGTTYPLTQCNFQKT
jgi:hypothetical protein